MKKRGVAVNDTVKHEAAVAEVVDLTRFDAMQTAQEDGLDINIKDPNGKPMGLTIKIAGPDSSRQRRALERMAAERLAQEDPAPLSPAELYERQTRGLAIATISWTPFKLDGKILQYSEEAAYDLYNRFPFIRDQVADRAGRRSAFFALSNGDVG
jgi:hypothetical protein